MLAVSAQDVVKEFSVRGQTLRAVDHVSLDVPRGSLFGFLGPNGAGKTTLMRMIHAVSPPSSGQIEVLGHHTVRQARHLKARLGVVPQENNLDPDFTVEQNLRVYARYFRIPPSLARERARELLEFVGLAEKANTEIDALSGGMKRRLVLARCLMNEPELLVLDEPTTGLDPQSRHLVWSKVRELRRRGLTILLTTHYMDEAERLCDDLVIIDNGHILVRGPPATLIRSHAPQDVLELGFAEDARRHESALRGMPAFKEARIEFVGERALAYVTEAENALAQAKERLPLVETLVRRATLEDVFLHLTGRGLRE